MTIVAWSLFSILLLSGFVGLFVPLLPGFMLILGGVLVHKLMLGDLSWWTVLFTATAFGATYLIDFMGSLVGAKWGGASRVGMIGLVAGGFIGLFFGLPGILIGPLLGVFIGELISNRTVSDAAKASAGATAGMAISTVLKVILALVTFVVVGLDLFLFT